MFRAESPYESDGSFYRPDSSTGNTSGADSSVTTEIPAIANEVLIGLNEFRNTGKFCDITLKVGDISISAHKVVLCACSPYFCGMFTGNFKEKEENVVNLHDIDGNHLRVIIEYMYTGNLAVTKDNVREILKIANFLQVVTAEEMCCELIKDDINVNNCLEYLQFATKHCIEALLLKSAKCAVEHFWEIYSKEDFQHLDFFEFSELLQQPEITDCIQDVVYCAIHKWIAFSPQDRLENSAKLLSYVDMTCVSDILIKESHLAKADFIEKETKRGRKCWWLYLFNKMNSVFPFKCMMFEETGDSIRRIPRPLYQASYTSLGGIIYVQGGWTSDKDRRGYFTDKTYCYDGYKNIWTPFIPLTVARSNHQSCFINERLYTIGGRLATTALDTVECLDLLTGQYTTIDQLPEPRASFGIVTHENCIYITGGHDCNKYINSVLRYDPRVGRWDTLSHQPHSSGICSSAIFKDSIYCTFDLGRAMERYEFRTDKWNVIKTLDNTYARELVRSGNYLLGVFKKRICWYDNTSGEWNRFWATQNTKGTTVVPLYMEY